MSTTTTQLEERVSVLEEEVARLKLSRAVKSSLPNEGSWQKIVGTFANDELFEEAVRLGREYRASQRGGD